MKKKMDKTHELQGEVSGHNKFTGIKRQKTRFVRLFCVGKILCCTGWGNVERILFRGLNVAKLVEEQNTKSVLEKVQISKCLK